MTVARSFLICNDDALATITLHRAHVATPDPHQRSPRDVPVRAKIADVERVVKLAVTDLGS
jgi:hypothetical protein